MTLVPQETLREAVDKIFMDKTYKETAIQLSERYGDYEPIQKIHEIIKKSIDDLNSI
jgi:hypothetical protein